MVRSDSITVYLGIDLAAKEKNPTGFCTIIGDQVNAITMYSNKQIVESIHKINPTIIAIDAPLIKEKIKNRNADQLLKPYGAMPPTMPSMKLLTKRGTKLAQTLEKQEYRIIEVFPTATAKILGFYDKNYTNSLKKLHMENVLNNKHEYDAYLCSLTARLYDIGKTEEVGDEHGKIIIPNRNE